MINFFKNQWFSLAIIFLLIFMQIKSDESIAQYEIQLDELQEKLDYYKANDLKLKYSIDSLSTLDKEVIEKIRVIKEKEYVQVKVVDSMPVSKLQQFFTDRY
ncbi:MAG: hypothetical protein CMJ25_22855 [Phycisphaerae bacterium]|nr:hypothetical protein [Phycisphaerae bacterium]|tara:strand:+ start:1039 stop:1344 length:306 start_codon:yes stop_codon:yes gene_type:complete